MDNNLNNNVEEINRGVGCSVRACKYHCNSNNCMLEAIQVTSDMNDKHFCGSYEMRSDVPEF